VSINPDYTKSEQEKMKQLKQEIKERANQGEKDLIIRKFTIVKKTEKQQHRYEGVKADGYRVNRRPSTDGGPTTTRGASTTNNRGRGNYRGTYRGGGRKPAWAGPPMVLRPRINSGTTSSPGVDAQ
jgi:hypothetical protein